MTETHEDRVKILEDAPDDTATHIDDDGCYTRYDVDAIWSYSFVDKRWDYYADMVIPSRSLSDMQQLVDMQNEIDELKSLLFKASEQIYDLPELEKEIMDALD